MFLVEIVTAFSILVFIVTGSAGALTLSHESVIQNKFYREAYAIAQHKIDEARQRSRTDSFNILHSQKTHESIYETSITESMHSENIKKVSVEVTWVAGRNKPRTASLSTFLTDVSGTLGSADCIVAGNWQQPSIIGSIFIENGNSPSAVVTWGNIALVTLDSANAAAPDLYIIDIADPYHPQLLSSLNTGPGLADIKTDGYYAYAANTSINSQLQIIDISNPSLPRLAKSYKFPGNYKDNTTIGHKLSLSNRKLYIGTPKSEIGEIHIIDVANPISPYQIGELEVGAGINDIKNRNDLLYVAVPANEELQIFDVSQPGDIKKVAALDLLGGSGNGKSLALLGPMLYIGRTYGAIELYAIKIDANPPKVYDTYDPNTNINTLEASPGLLFGGITGSPKLQMWDLTHGLTGMGGLNFSGDPTDIHCSDGNLIVTTENPSTLLLIKGGPHE